jgi:hypothetical protein
MAFPQEAKALDVLVGWPLLPVVGGGQLHPLLPLQRSPVMRAGPDWPEQLAALLLKLGCQ